jgi:hypothetical protein
MSDIDQIVADLQAHLQSAEVTDLGMGRTFRLPLPAITCRDGTSFSVQASEFTYCTPRNNEGPWTTVEVMTLTEGAQPRNWEHDAGDNLAGYVPIEAVAQEILDRGYLALTAR